MNNRVQRLALGTAQFGFPYGVANQTGKVAQLDAAHMVQLARSCGVSLLDTAKGYGDSEECLGAVGVQDFDIVTKFPVLLEECSDVTAWVRTQVEASCARLKIEKIYGLLVHHSGAFLGDKGKQLVAALKNLKERGLVKKIGVSIYAPEELDGIYSAFKPDIVQAPFNLVDRQLYSSGWMSRLKERGVEIHVRSVFLQGLLLMEQKDVPAKFLPWSRLWKAWHGWLAECGESALEVCLAFALHFPEIDRVLVGADGIRQLQEVIDAAKYPFSGEFPDIACADQLLINPSLWNEQ